jgi:protein SCO1/2
MHRTLVRLLVAMAAFTAGLVVAVQYFRAQSPRSGIVENASRPLVSEDFELRASQGTPFHWRDARGAIRLVYFGFTHCPDACPTTLATATAALRQAKIRPGARAVPVRILFVTVDPERDTPEVMKAYVTPFGTAVSGLTGTPAQVARAAAAFHIYYKRVPVGEDPADYMVEHDSRLFLVDGGDRIANSFPGGTSPGEIARALEALQ